MPAARRHPRITDPQDFQAKLGPSDRFPSVDRVAQPVRGRHAHRRQTRSKSDTRPLLNSTGPSFHYAGVAEVVHLTNEDNGLAPSCLGRVTTTARSAP